ncbi:transposase [Roseimaritima ulvae]|uniref:Transposase IS200 like protein n=1 Tax=Roseimaritima ulvae TaxID=980254 RepID=A0A5B9QMN0_9BACT|nr:transposase [Roseimaritima ulvae]QEG39122.1 Transposase IS200 like protein [Roseimaritima ulvae]
MSQSLARVYLHCVFSTKQRRPFLRDSGLRNELFPYMATVFKNEFNSHALRIGGVEDHIHALVTLPRVVTIAELIKVAKTETSKWVKQHAKGVSTFSWQGGYGAFSVSQSNVEAVSHYIDHQEKHHLKESFKDEFRKLCRRHGIELDERYAWD